MIFLNRRRFYTNQPSVHMKPVNLDTETKLFWKCTPERCKAPVHTNLDKKMCDFKHVGIRVDTALTLNNIKIKVSSTRILAFFDKAYF